MVNKDKYRILAIAPFQGFQNFFLQEVQKRDDIKADIFSANLYETEALFRTLDLSKYEVIVCRGRSGRLLKELSPIPVINVDFSSYDILRALQLATLTTQRKIAFVSYFDLGDNIHFLSQLLNYQTEILVPPVPKTEEEMEELIKSLYYDEHIQLFVGDGACVHCAKKLNANSILVTTGPESMRQAVNSAVELCEMRRKIFSDSGLYKELVEKSSLLLAIFDTDRNLIFSSLFNLSYKGHIHKELSCRISRLQSHHHMKFILADSPAAWRVTGEVIYYEHKPYYLFHVEESIPLIFTQSQFWEIIDYEKASSFLPLINGNPCHREYLEQNQSIMVGKTPVVIFGSPGSGKTMLSYGLYAQSPYISNPLIEIDCYHLNEKQCEKLFKDERSPLFDKDYTILFKNLNSLSPSLQNLLAYYLETLELTSRHKVICTYTGDPEDMMSGNRFSQKLSYLIYGFPIQLPSINSRPELIVPIARSYLNHLNQELPVQIAGLEPEALNLLEEHHWKYGITQFQTVLRQLVMESNNQFITTENVRSILSRLDLSKEDDHTESSLNLHQPLDDIVRDVIELVLKEESMNQTKAAKRLGISRSTLWKKLKS